MINMLRRGRNRIVRLIATISLLIIVTGFALFASTHPIAQTKASAANSPILFVHGWNLQANGTCNTPTSWGSAKTYLSSHGYTGQLITIGFYNGDTNCDVNLKDEQDSHCNNYFAGNAGTTNEDERHIACDLDWYIWNNFTQYGQNVQLVAHSMGGIIIRWAIHAAGSSSSLPPYLYAQNAVTMATPHNGVPWGASLVCANCLQMENLQPGSSLLSALRNDAQNPQAQGGTTWTLLGSSCESWLNGGVDPSSEMGMVAQHKVLYLNPPCYHHGGYLTDQSDSLDAQADYCDNACTGKPNSTTGYSAAFPHSLRELLSAIS